MRPVYHYRDADRLIVPPRHFDCAQYNRCLDIAITADWESWSCTRCPLAPTDLVAEDLGSRPPVELFLEGDATPPKLPDWRRSA